MSGRYELISGERGWARLNHCGRNSGFNQATIHVAKANAPDCVTECEQVGVPSEHSYLTEETFGVGFARYNYICPMGLQVTRVMSVQSSIKLHQGNVCFLLTVTMENTGEKPYSDSCSAETFYLFKGYCGHWQTWIGGNAEFRLE